MKIIICSRYFDGSKAYIDPVFDDPNFVNIVNVLNKAIELDETKREFQNYLGELEYFEYR